METRIYRSKTLGCIQARGICNETFFLTVYPTIDRKSTVLGAMNNASERYRETYDEKKKAFSCPDFTGLVF